MINNITKVLSWAKQDNQLILNFEKGKSSISITENNLVRFRYTKKQDFSNEENYVLNNSLKLNDYSLSINDRRLVMFTDFVKVIIDLDTFQLRIFDENNNEVISSDNDFLSAEDKTTTVRLKLADGEKIYGLGQDPMANLNQRDKERRVWHQYGHIRRSGNIGVPFMISSKNYGVFLNSSYPSRFEIGEAAAPEYDRLGILMAEFPSNWTLDAIECNPNNTAIILNEDDIDLWFMIEKNKDDIIKDYYSLTGKAALLPKWAYGFVQCNCRYRSQDEMLQIAEKMREKGVPCDVLLIDWLWFREFGDLKWDDRYWRSPKEMFARLKELGFKVMMAQHPFISMDSINYELFKEIGYLNENVRGSRVTYDHTNPEARSYWWSRIKEFYDEGIKGYWADMGELEEHHIGTKSFLGDRDKIHNIYMTLWTKGLYEGQRRDFGERFFALNRATYPGIQKYGTVLWSGDIDASWEVMKEQVVIGQGVTMSGIPFWSTDIGGFLTVDGYTAELFVRWLQWNVFCPIFRVHGARPGNEIWSFGEQTEEICMYFVKMRYQLLPYIYSMAYNLRENGAPMMRAMAMDFANDDNAIESVYQFMFGNSLLVSPVVDKGERHKGTYLPEGIWYDYYTGEKYTGIQSINASAPLEKLPLFIKGGSIIPMIKSDNQLFISEELEKNIEINVYPGNNANFILYDDDGVSFEYEETGFIRTIISYEEKQDIRKLKISKSEGSIQLERSYNLLFHDINEPVSIGGYKYLYNKELRQLEVKDIVLVSSGEVEISFEVQSNLPKVGKTNDLSDIRIFVDSDLENEGRLKVTFTWENDFDEYSNYMVKARFETEPYWTIEKEDNSFHNAKMYSRQIICHEEIKENHIGKTGSMSWTAIPVADYMPAKSEGFIKVEIYNEDTLVLEKMQYISWGSGCITRWSVVSCFRNEEDHGMDTVFEPELNSKKPYYLYEGKKLPWIKDSQYEFNCFGYVELRRYGSYEGPGSEGMNGISYLKNSTYCETDMDAYLNISSELEMKVWLNDELVHSSNDLVIDKTEPKAIHFKKGYNKLFVKVGVYTEKPYSGREFGFNLRLLDIDSQGKTANSILFCN